MNSTIADPSFWSRLQFGFTLMYHYLFPQLTKGLAWFLVYRKWRALRTGDEKYNQAARFWARIFGLNFAVGVVTGIPWSFSSAPIAPIFRATWAVSSGRRWRWKGCSPSSSKALLSARSSLAISGSARACT